MALNVQDDNTPEKEAAKLEKNKFIFEIVKWAIGSVVIVAVTMIIDNGFKERTAGIQEMLAYDKYVSFILKADNIEERWKLAEYFSTVTPTPRLRDRWIAYKDSINADYLKFKNLKQKEFILQQQKNEKLSPDSTSKTDKKLNEIQNQLAPFENKLISSDNPNTAADWEKKGFLDLLNKDVQSAIISFTNCENLYNSYHQSYEIAKYLTLNQKVLMDNKSDFWKTAYKTIATDFSWKMPLDFKTKFIILSK